MTLLADFATYWNNVDGALARCPAAPALSLTPLRSTPFSTAWDLRLTSIGPYRIFGYLSVPHGDGPFPALLHTPRYGSVINPPHWDDRQRYVVLSLMHRGQRLADSPYQAAYPGLLTDGIEHPASYIYRGVVADCLRGAEYLASHPTVDPKRIGIAGDDLALITAARRPYFSTINAGALMFYRLMESRLRTDAYPVEEINDYLRLYPQSEALVEHTLALFDPLRHAPVITAATFLQTGDPGTLGGQEWLQPLGDAISGNVTHYTLSHEGGTDYDSIDSWLANQLGVQPLPRLWTEAR